MKKENIRNFVIISHIDHGKSTLADRFLEITSTVSDQKMREQFLDQMGLEKEKGITIKMHPVSMDWEHEGEKYRLNLIDTPGHVDFNYEVSRALAAVEGAILLVDATQGIQAQTIRNLELAEEQGLKIIPVVNKIDLSRAQIKKTKEEIASLTDLKKKDVFAISAKEGDNVEKLLVEVIRKIPAPECPAKDFQGLIFDSQYNSFQGVVAFVRVFSGVIKKGQEIEIKPGEIKGEVKEVGYFRPQREKSGELKAGQIGYIATGVKESNQIRVGQTIIRSGSGREPVAGYQEAKPVVFNGLYTREDQNFELLKNSLEKLKLNDAALSFELQKKKGLGRGFQVGFLGLLHAEIVIRRLEEEFGLDLIVTAPSVNYHLLIDNQWQEVNSAVDWPHWSEIEKIKEPWVRLSIFVEQDFFGGVMKILNSLHGELQKQDFVSGKFSLEYITPFREIVSGFDNKIKSATQGRASYDFEFIGYKEAEVTQLKVLVAGEEKPNLTQIVAADEASTRARQLADKLYELLPDQQFKVPIQIEQEGNIIARRTLKAQRKDVTASLYGGDYTRKKKLLSKQRNRKKQMAQEGRLDVPTKVLLEIWKN